MEQVKKELKVIFFDAGGVLFHSARKEEDDRIRYLLMERGFPRCNIDRAIIKAKQIKPKFIRTWREEEQYFKKFYGTIAKELGDSKLTDELFFLAHYVGHCELYPEVKEVLATLSKRYRLGVISNAMPSVDWAFDRLGIRRYFESIVISAFVNAEKPDQAIYQMALQQVGVKHDESIFIDDKIENIKGAEQAGIRGLHLDRDTCNLLELLKGERLI